MATGDRIYIADKATQDSIKSDTQTTRTDVVNTYSRVVETKDIATANNNTTNTINSNVNTIKTTTNNIKTDTTNIINQLANSGGGGGPSGSKATHHNIAKDSTWDGNLVLSVNGAGTLIAYGSSYSTAPYMRVVIDGNVFYSAYVNTFKMFTVNLEFKNSFAIYTNGTGNAITLSDVIYALK